MNISLIGGTIRFEGDESLSWPAYMPCPVDHEIPKEMTTAINTLLGEDLPEGRIIKDHMPVRFNDYTCTIQAGSDKITPETDLSSYPEEVRVFAQTIYSFDSGRYAEIYRLSQLEDEPDTPVTVTENVYDADGVTVVDRKEIPVMETVIEPVDVKMEGKWMRLNRPVERQKVRTGRKVSDADKQRLEELRNADSEPLR